MNKTLQVKNWLDRRGLGHLRVTKVDYSDLGRSICFFIDARGEDYLAVEKLLPELNRELGEGHKALLEP